MIKLFFLIIFFLGGSYSLKAAEALEGDQEFASELDHIKSPFEEGIPNPIKPIMMTHQPVHHQRSKPIVFSSPKPRPVVSPMVSLPALNLQGIMVGEDMHEVIINDQVVPLHGVIEGVRVDSVTKQGVELFFKGKKFFLKVD